MTYIVRFVPVAVLMALVVCVTMQAHMPDIDAARAEAAYTEVVALEQEVAAAAEAQRASFSARAADRPVRARRTRARHNLKIESPVRQV